MNRTMRKTAGILWLALLVPALASLPDGVKADDLKDGRTALQAGRYDEAIKSFEKAAQQGLAAGRAGVGQVWLRRMQFEKAMEAFQIAQKMDPQLALAYYGQGEVLRRQDRCQEAVALFDKATSLDRKFPEAQMGKGECLVKTKRFDEGVLALTEGLKWGTKWRPRFLVALGKAEMSRDSLRDAGIYFTKAREEAPNDPEVRRALGDFYVQRGTWDLAVLETQAAVALDTTDMDLRFSLAQALYHGKRYDEALEQYQWITTHEPDYAPGLLAMGNLLYLAGSGANDPQRYQQARAPLERYTQVAPQDPKGWSLLGRTLYSLRLRDEGLAAMEKAEQLGDKSKEMYTMMGRAYAERRDYDKALRYMEMGERGVKEHLLMAQMYVFRNDIPRADSIYRAIIEQDSTTADARFARTELAKQLFRQKDYAGAVAMLQRRIALDPSHGETYYYLGLSLKELKRFPEATDALQKAAALDSTKADRFFWLGVLNDQQKAIAEARRAFEQSVALDDSSKLAGKAHRQLGFYLLLDKDWPGAIRRLERAVELDAQDVQAWVWLGQGYQNSGNREKAMAAYRRALAIDPNQPEANKGVKVLSGAATGSSKGG
jgi:tetratricopeptide (TPR) repeat protein